MNANKKGFTLLELLIVITIISVLSVILIVALNPAETLRKARDTQRLSDLASLKTALGIYTTTVSNPTLEAAVSNFCLDLAGTNTAAKIGYSVTSAIGAACTADIPEGADVNAGTDFSTTDFCAEITSGTFDVDGTGWVPVDLADVTGGSPLSNLPADPTNTISGTTPDSADLVYRYACQEDGGTGPDSVFEFNAILESAAFGPGSATDDKSAKDGGDNDDYYEVGTSLRLIGDSTSY